MVSRAKKTKRWRRRRVFLEAGIASTSKTKMTSVHSFLQNDVSPRTTRHEFRTTSETLIYANQRTRARVRDMGKREAR